MMKLNALLSAICLMAGVSSAGAHDFSATVNGRQLNFEITSKAKRTVAVTYGGSIADRRMQDVTGTVEIPSRVSYENVYYDVTAISPKAFANADRLKGIVIPSGVRTIGDFAFEGCDSLTSVIFPGNKVSLGQGVFFKCPAIRNVTIGSDWESIDLSMFRWSKCLSSIFIPAGIDKLQGVKKLRRLTSISVDPNNARFSSADGMLFSKDGTVLYACPRAYEGKVAIKAGVTKVLDGALIDCTHVTAIDFPASLCNVSFRETSRMKELKYIVMRADRPIDTGYIDGHGKFFFQLASPKALIVIDSETKRLYESSLPNKPGEYSANIGSVPYTVTKAELPTAKNLKGVRNFDKY